MTENTHVERIVASNGIARGLTSFLVPGLAQIISGDIGKGLGFLLIALLLSIPTFGIAWFISEFMSFATSKKRYLCGHCGVEITEQQKKCHSCHTYINKEKEDESKPMVVFFFALFMIVLFFTFIFLVGN